MEKGAIAIIFFLLNSINYFAYGTTSLLTSKDNLAQTIMNAKTNDTIILRSGIYLAHDLVVDKPLTIIGIDYPTIDGERKGEIFSIKSPGVLIRGLHIIHCDYNTLKESAAIKVYDTANVILENNDIEDNYIGIYLQYSRNCKIINNNIHSNGTDEQSIGNGVHAWKCDSIQIIGNKINGHRDGIYLEFVTHSIVWRNVSEKNVRYGLHFMFSHEDAYITNVFRNNGSGVAVMFTHKVTMINNTFEDNWGDAAYGLLLKEIVDSYIEGNKFIQNTAAMYADGMNRCLIAKNQIDNNGWGIKLRASCIDNKIIYNNFIGNTFDVSTNGSLTLNVFEDNYWDKYEGYDINKDKIGDVPYHPLSLFGVVAEHNPLALLFFRSFIIGMLDKSEKLIPSITPESFVDNSPHIKPFIYD